jgi:hypothetical protein
MAGCPRKKIELVIAARRHGAVVLDARASPSTKMFTTPGAVISIPEIADRHVIRGGKGTSARSRLSSTFEVEDLLAVGEREERALIGSRRWTILK